MERALGGTKRNHRLLSKPRIQRHLVRQEIRSSGFLQLQNQVPDRSAHHAIRSQKAPVRLPNSGRSFLSGGLRKRSLLGHDARFLDDPFAAGYHQRRCYGPGRWLCSSLRRERQSSIRVERRLLRQDRPVRRRRRRYRQHRHVHPHDRGVHHHYAVLSDARLDMDLHLRRDEGRAPVSPAPPQKGRTLAIPGGGKLQGQRLHAQLLFGRGPIVRGLDRRRRRRTVRAGRRLGFLDLGQPGRLGKLHHEHPPPGHRRRSQGPKEEESRKEGRREALLPTVPGTLVVARLHHGGRQRELVFDGQERKEPEQRQERFDEDARCEPRRDAARRRRRRRRRGGGHPRGR
mmetsp:Transcript_2212/g.5907  ORF Transcript_2212/g.5907 Transcript_2212/m.5907 type:complete len:344 (-) Transcript_2212:877-1908(-)